MSEEEIIERIKDLIRTCNVGIQEHGEYDDLFELDKTALEGILELYKKEKEKTPESVRKQFEVYQNRICELEEAIKELKEKNKELEEHQKQYLDGELITANQGKFFEKIIKENYIRKDRIRAIMEDLNNKIKKAEEIEAILMIKQQQILQKVLEE